MMFERFTNGNPLGSGVPNVEGPLATIVDFVLFQLSAHDGLTTRQIAERCGTNPFRVVRVLSRLKSLVLIHNRVIEQRPGRRTWHLSQRGREAVEEAGRFRSAA